MNVRHAEDCLVQYQSWLGALAELIGKQCELITLQYRLGTSVLDALWGGPMEPTILPAPPGAAPSLEERARERMRQGLPPPPEVYEVQNRGRIDWMAAPSWARPADPELFEGCVHEG